MTPLPGSSKIEALITAAVPEWLKGLIGYATTTVGGNGGDGRQANPTKADSPVWQGLRGAGNGIKTDGDRLHDWDYTHNDIEVYDKRGRHLGSADPVTGELYKPAVPGRRLNR